MSHGSGLVRTTCSSGGALGPGQPSEGLLDRVYPLTHGALFKVAQMVTLLIDYGAHSFFEVVTMCDLIMILIFYLVHLFRFYRVLTCISWPLSELLHYLIGTLLLLIASIVIASKSYNQSGLVAGAGTRWLGHMAPRPPSWNREENQRDGPVAVSSLFFPLQIFGFLASFLCLASLWLSYKITCITQSSDASA